MMRIKIGLSEMAIPLTVEMGFDDFDKLIFNKCQKLDIIYARLEIQVK